MTQNIEQIIAEKIKVISIAISLDSNPGTSRKHPEYQGLIKLGEPALPILLEKLALSISAPYVREVSPFCCLCALKDISNQHPKIAEEHRGKVKKIAETWLRWGAEKGLCESPN